MPAANAPTTVIEGRYDLKADRALDYTIATAGTVFGVSTSQGYGVELAQDGQIAAAYLQDGQISPSVFIAPTKRQFSFNALAINGADENGNISFAEYSTYASIQFSNGPKTQKVNTITNIKLGIPAADYLASNGCSNGVCKSNNWKVVTFANGQGEVNSDVNQIEFSYLGDLLLQIKPNGSHSANFQYTIPKNLAGLISPYRFFPNEINFNPAGYFSFKFTLEDGKDSIELARKDGTIVTTAKGATYDLTFDRDGYLIEVTP